MHRYHLHLSFFLILLLVVPIGCDWAMDPPTPPEINRVDRFPAWSPDGSQIAYWHNAGRTADSQAKTGLYVLDLDANSTWLVTEGRATSPDWRPDGERIALSNGDIFTIRPDGSDLRQVTNFGNSFRPRWSPDGQTLTFGRSGTTEEVGVWFAHLADSTFSKFGFGATPADWSPSGDRIVYKFQDQFWIADTSATDSVQITDNNVVNNRYPAWSPDGQWITWTKTTDDDQGVWIMRDDGTDKQKLATRAREPAWGPQSERIVFSKPARDSDYTALWTIRRDGSDLQQLTDPSRNPLN